MLILTRRPGETVHIGDEIRVTVLGMQGKQVKLGIDVPASMVVYREELYRRVQEENRMALEVYNDDLVAATQLWKTTQ